MFVQSPIWFFGSLQEAEKQMDSKHAQGKRQWMAHNWGNSYFGACLIMLEETGQDKYAP
jgi:hypothetical protein